MGFEQKRSKDNILIQFAKSPVRQATLNFAKRQVAVRAARNF